MSAIAFLTACTIVIGALIALFFWMAEGGGSIDKVQKQLSPLAKLAVAAWSKSVAIYRNHANQKRSKAFKARRSVTQGGSHELPELDGRLHGEGDFRTPVAGESHYQVHLRKVEKTLGRGYEEDGHELHASIITEPDNPHDRNACAIYMAGKKVGYLPRDVAKEYVKAMAKQGIRGVSHFQVKARLIGGYSQKKHIGVVLDLPDEL